MPVKSKKEFDRALKEVDTLVSVANTYARDGAFHTAALRLEQAAQEMKKAAEIKDGWLQGLTS